MQDLSVKAVSWMTGINAHTLRAWENRYNAVVPRRSASGRRIYDRADVNRLQHLKILVDRGHSIGAVANLSLKKLEELAALAPARTSRPARAQPFVREILERLASFELAEVYRLIQVAQHHGSLKDYLIDVISPVLGEVGRRVSEGGLDMAGEHAISALLRHHLGGLLHETQARVRGGSGTPGKVPIVALTTPEGDLHEFGILISAILFSLHGCQVVYLGPNLPAESLAAASKAAGARLIVLGTGGEAASGARLQRYVERLDSALSKGQEIWLGGEPARAANLFAPQARAQRFISDFRALDEAITRLNA